MFSQDTSCSPWNMMGAPAARMEGLQRREEERENAETAKEKGRRKRGGDGGPQLSGEALIAFGAQLRTAGLEEAGAPRMDGGPFPSHVPGESEPQRRVCPVALCTQHPGPSFRLPSP